MDIQSDPRGFLENFVTRSFFNCALTALLEQDCGHVGPSYPGFIAGVVQDGVE